MGKPKPKTSPPRRSPPVEGLNAVGERELKLADPEFAAGEPHEDVDVEDVNPDVEAEPSEPSDERKKPRPEGDVVSDVTSIYVAAQLSVRLLTRRKKSSQRPIDVKRLERIGARVGRSLARRIDRWPTVDVVIAIAGLIADAALPTLEDAAEFNDSEPPGVQIVEAKR